jgi:hypothetical protein
MRIQWCLVWITLLTATATQSQAENLSKAIKKAVERGTLDQPGTKPFHLKASVAPSFERDKDSGRTGTIEIWWASPTQWKRDVSCPLFRQIEIVNGSQRWQKVEGDYFPQWLERTAIELVKPIPPLEDVLEHAKSAETRTLMGQTNLNWVTTTGTPDHPNISRSWVALKANTGELLYAGGLGWGADFNDYRPFHDRLVARVVKVGSPEVTATIAVLEDLGVVPPSLFDTGSPGSDLKALETIVIDEGTLRKNLVSVDPIVWPPLQDGPLEGNLTTQIVVDREGKVRDIGTMVSENPGIDEGGRRIIAGLRFKPFLVNDQPTQVFSQITLPFKTTRPSGTEHFESAKAYFDRGRRVNFPAAGGGKPYALRAEFEVAKSGNVEKGRYEDMWLSESQWRREAWLGNSHYVRSRNGDKAYQLADGPDTNLLRFLFRVMEPIPATDTFVESDWRIKRDTVNGVPTIRVLTGYESPEGKLDPEQVRGFWFDNSGTLVKTYFRGIESQRLEFQTFGPVVIAHRVDLLKDGAVGMRIRVTEISPAEQISPKAFDVRGHEWTRAFTDEVR